MSEKNNLETALNNYTEMKNALNDLTGLAEMAEEEGDEAVVAEVMQQLEALKQQARRGELEALLSGEVDGNDAYLEVHAGSGGTEAQDWAEMLLRMYTRWAEAHKYKVDYVEETEGDVAGLKSATVKISGHNAYGWLKSETGVHRLVRISPFDSAGRRHTSFASVGVYPVIDDKIEKAIQAERDKLKYEINKDIDDKIDQYNRMMKDILGLRLNSNNNDAAKTLKDISK